MYFPTIVMINRAIASMDENASKSAKGKLRSLKKRAAAQLSGDGDVGQSSSESGEEYERGYAHDTGKKGRVDDDGVAAGIGTRTAQRPPKKVKRSTPAPANDSIAKHISQQTASALGQPASYHEDLGSRNSYSNLSLMMNSSTPEGFQGMNRFNNNAQALSSLLTGRSADASLNPRSYLGGGNPLFPTQSSLAATLASQNQPLLGHSGLLSSSIPTLPFPNVQQQFSNSNQSDAILNMLIAQRFPSHFQHQHQHQQPWSGQPSLTSLSIQQLLSSPYASLHNSANQFLLGGNTALSNEPNFSLRQNELSDRLGPVTMMAQQRFAEEPVRPSIRHYAAAISHLLGEDVMNQHQGLQSQALAATTALATRAANDPPKAAAPADRDNNAEANDEKEEEEERAVDIGEDVPKDLPFIIGLSEDKLILNDHQVFLRQQIEVFRATKEDVSTHTRGRTKQVRMGQIGIRCRHCAHLPITVRGRGSIYFPSQLMGIYQVAQNMAKLHFLGGGCSQVPPETIQQFQKARDTVNSGVGRVYWTQAAKKVGLLDSTDNCIRFVRDLQGDEKRAST